ncbi:hypothetical protein [Aliidiomarina soli]|uniref:Uncharacterized protein n=1 Tax=Aliidiomarina soli TaxID=1928574 RepID=A0A432WH72_9GAMM|nr:hypothetical protein [Aliidiomarina soli]RUO33176.1 hypothetical protein CWE14_08090 [Aliidiomarina soli]
MELPKKLPVRLSKKDREFVLEELHKIDYMTVTQCKGELSREYYRLQAFYAEPHGSYKPRDMEPRDFFVHFRQWNFLSFGYINALIQNDPQSLLNTLYSFNRYNQVIHNSSGYDHGGYAWKALYGYAANDDVYIDFVLPRSLPLSVGRVSCHIVTDCIIALRNPEFHDTAVDSAERFLQNKRSNNDRALVGTMLSILKNDAELFSHNLQESVNNHRRAKWSYSWGLLKLMPILSYGMLAVAKRYLSNDQWAQVELPEHPLWWPEFVAHNEAQGYQPGEHLIEFDGELSFMNDAESMMEIEHKTVEEMRAEYYHQRKEYQQGNRGLEK